MSPKFLQKIRKISEQVLRNFQENSKKLEGKISEEIHGSFLGKIKEKLSRFPQNCVFKI